MLTVAQAMQQANAAYAGGDWAKAEQFCRLILHAHADHFGALHLLGIIAAQTQRPADAADLLRRAVASKPLDAVGHYNYGSVLKNLGRFDEALGSYQRAIDIAPNLAEAYHDRGNTQTELGRLEEALDSYQCALKIRPDYAEVLYNRGNAQTELGRLDEALDSYQGALKIKPDYAEAYNNRGVALHALKRFEEARESYERALEIDADYAEACYNHGLALRELGRFEEALDSYERALKIKPDYAEAHNNRGVALQALRRFEEARESYERALTIKPNLAEAWYGCGNALSELGRFEEALDSYERALKLEPDQKWLCGTWLLTKMQLCDWRDFNMQIANLDAAIHQGRKYSVPFPVIALRDSPSLQRRAAEIWANEAHREIPLPPWTHKRSRRERIRVGYYSADYHDHATAHLMAGLFERHDRARFELVAFSFGPDKRDEMRQRLSAAFDRFIDVRTRSDKDIALASREMEIDIAVDLKGFTQHERHGIFTYRAAPIQVNYLGCPGTMGAPYLDYIIADQGLIPEQSRPYYTEKVVYLPNSYQVNDRRRQIADRKFSRTELGLPATGFVFCCFNNSYKINPETFDGWMRILSRVEGSVLWLLEDNRTAVKNLRDEAKARGVSAARLIFAARMPQSEHLARHRAADLFIDTLPCNAHTTASDALWSGLPVLTRQGESLAARVAASLLNAIGLPELVTTTQEHYEMLAIELATDAGRLAEIREKLSRNRLTTPLFDTELCTRHIEDAYTQMYERYQADLSPEHIAVAG
jgi:predicted O-linked N-acetylglucosamine transferase (SPINDLY family)